MPNEQMPTQHDLGVGVMSEEIDAIEEAVAADMRKLGFEPTAIAFACRAASRGYREGWVRGHDMATARALAVLREAEDRVPDTERPASVYLEGWVNGQTQAARGKR